MIRSVRVHEFGGPEVLRIEEVEVEEPGVGEVRIRIRAIGINRTEITLRSGRLPAKPPLRGNNQSRWPVLGCARTGSRCDGHCVRSPRSDHQADRGDQHDPTGRARRSVRAPMVARATISRSSIGGCVSAMRRPLLCRLIRESVRVVSPSH